MRYLIILVGLSLVFCSSASAVTISSDATISNHDYGTEQVTVLNRAHVTFDNVTWGAYNANGGYEGRLEVTQGATVTVKNSKFGPGGCSDGIQVTSGGSSWPDGVIDVTNTEFVGIRQGSCGPHVDAVQFYGGHATRFSDNYVHDVSTGVEGYDSNGQMDLVQNNVMIGDEAQAVLLATSNKNGLFSHNVILGRDLHFDPGHNNVAPTGNVIKDNVADSIVIIGGSGNTVTNNLTSSQVNFVGGTGRCAYKTTRPLGTATDGTDIGLNDCGVTPPPPLDTDGDGVPDSTDQCPTVSGPASNNGCPVVAPTDHTPIARFTASPEPSYPGQAVTFDASASLCEDTACTYHWHDVDSSGTGDWAMGPNGVKNIFTFQGLGIKYVELVVTDADGDVSKVEHNHSVVTKPTC